MISADPDLWDDAERAQEIMQERASVQSRIDVLEGEAQTLEDAELMIEMAQEEGDMSVLGEILVELKQCEARIEELETQRMLGGEHDKGDAIVSINAGAGGTESQDWASMLFRMVNRYSERKGWKTSLSDYQSGDEAGIKSATIEVKGEYAYGLLKAESGVHRLVRISPYDSASRRHTSFASIFVYPVLDDSIEIEINEKDLKIDTYRASGAGGQHVNRTDSAVRITHLPSNIVVTCQNERSQHKNRATAMKILKSRLYEKERQEREAEMDAVHATKMAIDFGSQIRSYVLHPYQMVKDHRTNLEIGNVDRVLDGDLDDLINTFLLASAPGGDEDEA